MTDYAYDDHPVERDRLLAEGSLTCVWGEVCMRPATHVGVHPELGRAVACDVCDPPKRRWWQRRAR